MIAKAIAAISGDSQDEVVDIVTAMKSGQVSDAAQPALNTALTAASGAMFTGVERLQGLVGTLPAPAQGPVQNAINRVTGILQGLFGGGTQPGTTTGPTPSPEVCRSPATCRSPAGCRSLASCPSARSDRAPPNICLSAGTWRGQDRAPPRGGLSMAAPAVRTCPQEAVLELAVLSFRDLVPAIWLPDPRVRAGREQARFRMLLVKHRSMLTTTTSTRPPHINVEFCR